MNHIINLDAQGEAVKQFFLSLPVSPEGAVVELNGQALARLVPNTAADNGHSDDEEWTDAKNERRCELIDRKYERGLTAFEEAELAALQAAMYRQVDRVAPLPLEETWQLHQQLLQTTEVQGRLESSPRRANRLDTGPPTAHTFP